MRISTATSTRDETLLAGREVVDQVTRELGANPPDLAFLFITPHHAPELEEVAEAIAGQLNAPHLIGCTAESVIGGSEEHERTPAITLWAASLPGAKVQSRHLRYEETPDGYVFLGMPDIATGEATTMFLLGEPMSFATDLLLSRMSEDYPGLPIIGGMASGAQSPGENRLFLGATTQVDGAVVATVSGDVRIRPAVSQGCRPFGKSFIITKADRNLVVELGGKPVLEQLSEQLDALSARERAMIKYGLHLGIAIDANKGKHRRGDFLVRNIVGVDEKRGALAVTDAVRAGSTVRFHLRDAEAASEDLDLVLEQAADDGADPVGALIFSCNGRGQRLFEVPHHDAHSVNKKFSSTPLAGFFAAGELGPIGGQNFLHGFTASIALFERISPTKTQ